MTTTPASSDIREMTDLLKKVRDASQRALTVIDESLAYSAELKASREKREAAVRAQALKEVSELDLQALSDLLFGRKT